VIRPSRAWGHTAVTFSSLRGSVLLLPTHTLGAVVAAAMRLMEGEILHDQSMLTGESIPIEAVARLANLSKALVRRGVALARP
jgi:hypothetical protein